MSAPVVGSVVQVIHANAQPEGDDVWTVVGILPPAFYCLVRGDHQAKRPPWSEWQLILHESWLKVIK